VNQVATVKDGHAWKIFARTGDKIIILTYATDTRIGVKAGNYWIAIHTCSLSFSVGKQHDPPKDGEPSAFNEERARSSPELLARLPSCLVKAC
jgi:hypothetical protein